MPHILDNIVVKYHWSSATALWLFDKIKSCTSISAPLIVECTVGSMTLSEAKGVEWSSHSADVECISNPAVLRQNPRCPRSLRPFPVISNLRGCHFCCVILFRMQNLKKTSIVRPTIRVAEIVVLNSLKTILKMFTHVWLILSIS